MTTPVPLMTRSEARACVETIRAGLENVRECVLDLYERQGWQALGFASWRECVVAEFGQSERQLYRALEAGRIERELSNWTKVPVTLPESQARELARIKEPETIREVWQEVRETHPKPTALVIREAVERRLNPVQEYVCTDCGEVHPTRECPNCSEPVPASRTQGEAILSLVAADPSVQNASLRLAYARAASAVTNQLLSLDPESIAALLDGGSRVSAARFGDSVRVWVDRFDTALRRGVHVVKES